MATLKLRKAKTAEFAAELERAEGEFNGGVSAEGSDGYVYLKVTEVELRPLLFQPRGPAFGTRDIDRDHVSKLMKEIESKGELDPILVIKLGEQWICVDGHHRIEAYKGSFYEKPLKCETFTGGSVRDAVDEGLRRNSKRQLTLENTDKQEAAWRHVVCDWGSKKEIASSCGISQSQVALMRRVKGAWEDKGPLGKRMKRGARGGPKTVSWFQARALYLELDQAEINDEERAQRLARALQSKMSDKLRKSFEVTKRALEIYSPDLVEFIRNSPQIEPIDPEDLFNL